MGYYYYRAYKLDFETRKQWELSSNPSGTNELPTFEQFQSFIENRYRALEFIEPHKSSARQNKPPQAHHSKSMLVTNSFSMSCEFCDEQHKLCFCKTFAKEPINSRREFVAKNNLCFNCLGGNHTVSDCKKPTSCRVCKKRHHSLLHPNGEFLTHTENESSPSSSDQPATSGNESSIVSCLSTGTVTKPQQVLLATALIKAKSKTGEHQLVRALIDQGSQACFITEATVQLLNLKRIPVRGTVTGLGNSRSTIARNMVHLSIQSRANPKCILHIDAYVLSRITSYLPDKYISSKQYDWLETKDLYLADPEFNTPNKIDILLGADVYGCIMKEGMVKNTSGSLIAQNTVFGWILSGTIYPVSKEGLEARTISVMHVQIHEDQLLKKFWELEEQINTKKIFTTEETRCEELYKLTTKRDENGRYVVRLPFREVDPACKSGNSRGIAETRFRSLERRFVRNPVLKEQYVQVIKEYLDLGPMRPVKSFFHTTR